MFKNALVSVTNKSGLHEFLQPLVERGLRVVSTGGTAKYLKEHGIPVVEIRDQTGYPEVMDGRVRTLHPRVHMALLARDWVPADMELLRSEGLEPFDLVIGNLYDFKKYAGKGLDDREVVEHIDIGGPSLLRASAKNYERITVICDPSDYARCSSAYEDIKLRRELAAKVFQHVSSYDQLIAQELAVGPSNEGTLPEHLNFQLTKRQGLRYGENPHQHAAWYTQQVGAYSSGRGWQDARILQGRELSYNNLLDLESAVACLRHFTDPTCVVVKHNNPCGVATASLLQTAVQHALASDPVSSFGGIVAINRTLDAPTAMLLSELFLECIVAPQVSEEALSIFARKKNLRVLEWTELMKTRDPIEMRSLSGGVLVQTADPAILWKPEWKILGSSVEPFRNDLLFAFRVVASLKSNAIALVMKGQTVGLGMGQVNRVDAVQQSAERLRKFFPQHTNVVLASDAFFPFPDSIEAAALAGVKWIIQPGGSKNDDAVFEKAQELGIGMVVTGQRHFRH